MLCPHIVCGERQRGRWSQTALSPATASCPIINITHGTPHAVPLLVCIAANALTTALQTSIISISDFEDLLACGARGEAVTMVGSNGALPRHRLPTDHQHHP